MSGAKKIFCPLRKLSCLPMCPVRSDSCFSPPPIPVFGLNLTRNFTACYFINNDILGRDYKSVCLGECGRISENIAVGIFFEAIPFFSFDVFHFLHSLGSPGASWPHFCVFASTPLWVMFLKAPFIQFGTRFNLFMFNLLLHSGQSMALNRSLPFRYIYRYTRIHVIRGK